MPKIRLPLISVKKDAEAHKFPIQIAYQTQEFIQGFIFYVSFIAVATGRIVETSAGNRSH